MHYLVKMLVEADTASDALAQAEVDCDTMVELGIIDWYDMDGRWGKSKAYGIKSKKGAALLREGMDCNRREFDRAMEAIRYMMENYSDDEIYEEKFTKTDQKESEYYLSRYQFAIVYGDTNAAAVYAMGQDLWGARVNSEGDLEHILKDENRKLWVVPVDVHN